MKLKLNQSNLKIKELKSLDYHKSNFCNIYIPISYANFFKDIEKRPAVLNEKEKSVEKIILNYKGNKVISCQKIAKMYEIENNNKISTSTVYRILNHSLKILLLIFPKKQTLKY